MLIGATDSSADIYVLKTSIVSYSCSELVHCANVCKVGGRGQLKCDGTCAEIRFSLSRKTDESI